MNKDILVNRFNPLKKEFIPENLVKVKLIETPKLKDNMLTFLDEEAYQMFLLFRLEGLYNGVNMIVDSGYRPYEYQEYILNYNLLKKGLSSYKTIALPGHSEHQTGLAIDLNDISYNFSNTNEFKWLKDNAYRYGFILRYPKEYTNLTGYVYEPWHYRYVGSEVAEYIYKTGITYDEYYEYFLANK